MGVYEIMHGPGSLPNIVEWIYGFLFPRYSRSYLVG